ncbi:MAG: ZIP family metal transporter [Solirubrobacterales bacterium]|nr:ZIP family metal transporter [Solirubrobacterales bacterium]
MSEGKTPKQSLSERIPLWAMALGVLAVIAVVLVAIGSFGGDTLPERKGPPIEDLAVEKTVLDPGEIHLTVRNAGPDDVTVAQATVNDSYVNFTGGKRPIGRLGEEELKLDYPWIDGNPYAIGLLTSTGVVIPHTIDAAVETPEAGGNFLVSMILIGLYVGIIPVTLGMLALPLLRRGGRRWTSALIAFTVGLLAFLAIDGTLEAMDLAALGPGVFGGNALVFLAAGLAFLVLSGIDSYMKGRRRKSEKAGASAWHLALMVAIGIGLHNFGEGLAIGSAYAVGELALGSALIIGFAIHNTTEGLAIVAPLASQKPRLRSLLGLGLIAGGPAILGALAGGSVSSDEIAAALIGIGVGAILQVVVQLVPAMKDEDGKTFTPVPAGSPATGALALYLTGLR